MTRTHTPAPLAKPVASCLGLVFALFLAAAEAREPAPVELQAADAARLFDHGKVLPAIRALHAAIAATPAGEPRLPLQVQLMELCAAGQDWRCVQETIDRVWPDRAWQPHLRPFYPDLVLHEARLRRWLRQDALFRQLLKDDAAQGVADPRLRPDVAAELNLVLHDHAVRTGDLHIAEHRLSAAVRALLLISPFETRAIGKVLIGLIGAHLHAQDLVAAFRLWTVADPYIARSVPHTSALFAEYCLQVGHLLAFVHPDLAVPALLEAARLHARLEIGDGARLHALSVAHGLAAAALVLGNRLEEAQAAHARHPLQSRKDAILARGTFDSHAEYYFGLADVFVGAAGRGRPDPRWRQAFAAPPDWRGSTTERNDLEAYRRFALGLLGRGGPDPAGADALLVAAAINRIDKADRLLRTSFEAFPLPGLLDRLVIGAGLTVAAERGGDGSLDLMLRGGEVLGRNLRHAIADLTALIGAEPDPDGRRSVHAYIQTVAGKREWEFERIRALLGAGAGAGAGPATDPAGLRRHEETATRLAALKHRLQARSDVGRNRALPTATSLRNALQPGEAFVGYFPLYGGIGKFCLTRDHAAWSVAAFEPEIAGQVRLLELAVSADHAPDPRLDAQFPVAAAMRLRTVLLGGLEPCLPPGTRVTVALPHAFSGVPLGALLAEEPPRRELGHDLRHARWLIRDLSFSRVVSARHFLATVPLLRGDPAARAFLGFGDPALPRAQAATAGQGAGQAIRNLAALPETAEELRGVASHFPGADILLGAEATEAALRARAAADYDVLHFATHGLLQQDQPGLAESALVLTPGSADGPGDDGILTASEISRLSLKARLVVLSACNTARYDPVRASLAVQDLQTAFAAAGVPALLATLWPIETAAARDIVTGFFAEWRRESGRGTAQALARAIRGYLDRADRARLHPRFWAPFVLMGNGAGTARPPGAGTD